MEFLSRHYALADNLIYFVGTPRQIKSLYDRLYEKTVYYPIFSEEPKFNPNRIYGLEINTETNEYCVVGSETIIRILEELLRETQEEIAKCNGKEI